jgi:transcriptional regulator with XRE-family HTH domain
VEWLRAKRELAGLSQIALTSRAGVSRMRYQLSEAGELVLRPDELEAVNRVLQDAIACRAAALNRALSEPLPAKA